MSNPNGEQHETTNPFIRFLIFVEDLADSEKFANLRVITGCSLAFLAIGMIFWFLWSEANWERSKRDTPFFHNQEVILTKAGCPDLSIRVLRYRPPAPRGGTMSDYGSYTVLVDGRLIFEIAAAAKVETQHCFYGRFGQGEIDGEGRPIAIFQHLPDVVLIVKGAGGYKPPPRPHFINETNCFLHYKKFVSGV